MTAIEGAAQFDGPVSGDEAGHPVPPAAEAATVTVALACFNHGHYLFEALESVLGQTRPAHDVIVVDDGSTDMTAQVCRLFPTVIYHYQDNAGLSAARNTALRLARTTHILFLDADDVLMPDALERGMRRFAERPEAAFVYGGYRETTVSREPIFEALAVEHADGYLGLLHDNHVSMHGTVIYDVAKLRAAGGFDTALKSCEDWDVYLKLAREHPIAAYPGIAADYRRHTGNMSHNSVRMIGTGRAVLERQIAAGLDPRQLRTARAGIEFNTRFYALQMIGEIRRHLAGAAGTLRKGLRHDRRFALRLAGAAGRGVLRKLGLARRGDGDDG